MGFSGRWHSPDTSPVSDPVPDLSRDKVGRGCIILSLLWSQRQQWSRTLGLDAKCEIRWLDQGLAAFSYKGPDSHYIRICTSCLPMSHILFLKKTYVYNNHSQLCSKSKLAKGCSLLTPVEESHRVSPQRRLVAPQLRPGVNFLVCLFKHHIIYGLNWDAFENEWGCSEWPWRTHGNQQLGKPYCVKACRAHLS